MTKYLCGISVVTIALFTSACADPKPTKPKITKPEITKEVPQVERDENAKTVSRVSVTPPAPDWVSAQQFDQIEVTPENKATLLKDAIALYNEKDYVAAYPRFIAAAENGQGVANYYLGLITGSSKELTYPRGALSYHYAALDSGAHATAIFLIARALVKGDIVKKDTVGAAQYYARLANVYEDKDHALVREARDYIRSLSPDDLIAAEGRETTYLMSKGLNPEGDLEALAASVSKVSRSSKAPGTESLAIRNFP